MKSSYSLNKIGFVKLEKTRENETLINKFKEISIGSLDGEQVDIKKIEISKSIEEEYRHIRNDVIVALYENKLRYTEIENLQVQDIDKSFALIRIQRGGRVFRVAISQQISEKMKLLIRYKDDKSYIFTKNLIEDKPISRTMITKIIKSHKKNDSNYEKTIKPVHVVERVCDKYIIYKNNIAIEGLVINNITNALRICDILNAD